MPKVVFEVTLTVAVNPDEFGLEWDWDHVDLDSALKLLAERVQEKIEDDLSDLEPEVDSIDVVELDYDEGSVVFDEEYEEDDCDDEECDDDWEEWEEDDDWEDDWEE
jgi:hypothetical protein